MTDDYLREIEQRYVALRGRGFALSAKDVGRVLAWQAEGVPLRLVLQTLEEAMRRWRADGARRAPTLGGLERSIDAAMKRRAERVGVAAHASVDERAAWARLAGVIERAGKLHDGPVRDELRAAWSLVQEREKVAADPYSVAQELDLLLVERLHRLLAQAERDTIEHASVAAARRSGPRMSPEAREERIALERARLVRGRFAVPELLPTILEPDTKATT